MPKAGDEFRDLIAAHLVAAGYLNVQIEYQIAGKVVDVYGEREGDFQRTRIAIEAKDYASTLPVTEVQEFKYEYSNLVSEGHVEQSILISHKSLSPAGKLAISSGNSGILYFTFDEFQRRIFGPEQYISKLVSEYKASGIENFYVPTHTTDALLDDVLDAWLVSDEREPLVVLGGYGTGKSTYALHLAHRLGQISAQDASSRIPIRITLGDLVQQNNLEGLFGEHFTAKYKVGNPQWNLIKTLNEQGRFIIIFDGFDEMKHGMTFHDFERQFEMLLTLAKGRAKILILGRDTAFRDDREFRAIILGKKHTTAGTEYTPSGRPECKFVQLRAFQRDESAQFIRSYFRYLNDEEFPGRNPGWISRRSDVLCSDRYSDLTVRPVHAQMLCSIATDDTQNIEQIDEFSLYDAFIDTLIRREVGKLGRYQGFDISQRRAANAALSWWLLSKDGSTSTTLREAPLEVFMGIVEDDSHSFTDRELVAELSAGCLLAKGQDTIYFGHRSIQEFLAAEHIFDRKFEPAALSMYAAEQVMVSSTEKVSDYLAEFFARREDGPIVANAAIESALGHHGPITLSQAGPFVAALPYTSLAPDKLRGAFYMWLQWIAEFGEVTSNFDQARTNFAAKMLRRARGADEVFAVMYLVALGCYRLANTDRNLDFTGLLTSIVDVRHALPLITEAKRQGRSQARTDADTRTYAFFECVYVGHRGNELEVKLDAQKAGRLASRLMNVKPKVDTVDLHTRVADSGYPSVLKQHFLNAIDASAHDSGKSRDALGWYLLLANQDKVRGLEVAKSTRKVERGIS